MDSSHTDFSEGQTSADSEVPDLSESCFLAEYKRSIGLIGELLLSQNPTPQGQVIMTQVSQFRQISLWSTTKKRKIQTLFWFNLSAGMPQSNFGKMTYTVVQ